DGLLSSSRAMWVACAPPSHWVGPPRRRGGLEKTEPLLEPRVTSACTPCQAENGVGWSVHSTRYTHVVRQGRLVSLDVFRGLTVAGMVLLNNPGTLRAIYPPLLP